MAKTAGILNFYCNLFCAHYRQVNNFRIFDESNKTKKILTRYLYWQSILLACGSIHANWNLDYTFQIEFENPNAN